MDLLAYALYLIPLVVMWKGGQFVFLWIKVIRHRVCLVEHRLLDEPAMPLDLMPMYREAEQALMTLGFRYSHAMEAHNSERETTPSRYLLVFLHPATHTYAQAEPALLPIGQTFDMTFTTLLANERILMTSNDLTHFELPSLPWNHRHDHYLGGVRQQWQAHQDTLAESSHDCCPVPCSPGALLAAENRLLRDDLMYQLNSGWLVRDKTRQQWHIPPWKACQLTWRLLKGEKKRTAARKTQR